MAIRGGSLVLLTDAFPQPSETFVAEEARALGRAGVQVRVEAMRRADAASTASDGLAVGWWEDDGRRARLAAAAWLVARHPLRCLHDLASRRRWRRQEPVPPLRYLAPAARRLRRGGEGHLHVHFAAGAALAGLRTSRLTGVPWSLTAHAYDIYRQPRNLREKLRAAGFVTSGCDYTVEDLRRIAGPGAARQVHKVIMGVDGRRFRRRAPHPGGRSVLAVGRLVEKKGFVHLVEAAGRLAGHAPLERLTIVGDGPLRDVLRERAAALGLEGVVELPGAVAHDEVRARLERADLLAMPSVVAADGDRDSMPVVVKEALAMEVVVVGSREVGLPEVIRPQWGSLVAPGDPDALAAAIEELLALPAETRAAMGRAGREFVLENCDVDREAARLAALVGGLQAGAAARRTPPRR